MTPNNDQPTSAAPHQHAPGQMQMRVPDEEIKGRYANNIQVDATPEEVILTFMSLAPQFGQGFVLSRIIMNPAHAKRFIEVMQRVISQVGKAPTTGDAAPITESTQKPIGFDVE